MKLNIKFTITYFDTNSGRSRDWVIEEIKETQEIWEAKSILTYLGNRVKSMYRGMSQDGHIIEYDNGVRLITPHDLEVIQASYTAE